MRTIKTVLDQLISPITLYEDLLETLKEIDPNFPTEEKQFQRAVASLKSTMTNAEVANLDTYLAAAQEEIAAIVIYTGWLGFQLNLDCWRNPINKLMLEQDYEEITQERSFESIPNIKYARLKEEAAAKGIPGNQKELLSDIGSFFSYLHTTAPKLAHLFGFGLADEVLQHVIPGYCPDRLYTKRYKSDVAGYLRLNTL